MAGRAATILRGVLDLKKTRESHGARRGQGCRGVAMRIVPGPNDILALILACAAMAA